MVVKVTAIFGSFQTSKNRSLSIVEYIVKAIVKELVALWF